MYGERSSADLGTQQRYREQRPSTTLRKVVEHSNSEQKPETKETPEKTPSPDMKIEIPENSDILTPPISPYISPPPPQQPDNFFPPPPQQPDPTFFPPQPQQIDPTFLPPPPQQFDPNFFPTQYSSPHPYQYLPPTPFPYPTPPQFQYPSPYPMQYPPQYHIQYQPEYPQYFPQNTTTPASGYTYHTYNQFGISGVVYDYSNNPYPAPAPTPPTPPPDYFQ